MQYFKNIKKRIVRRRHHASTEIAPDEIFLDSSNLPEFDRYQFEGRMEKPISRTIVMAAGALFLCVGLIFGYKVWNLQIVQGASFQARSEDNRLHTTVIFSDRGVVYDRNRVLLAWNEDNTANPDVSIRKYATTSGLANIIGYVKYPSKDSSGFYYREDYIGMDGVEKYFNDQLQGTNGTKFLETNSRGAVVSQSIMNPAKTGKDLVLSIDSRLQSALSSKIQGLADEVGFAGGAGIIMDVHTGEVLTDVSYPEYSSQIMTDGTNTEMIKKYLTQKNTPLLNRVANGLYVPGSIVKPLMGLAALDTHTISPEKIIYTHGSISIPNPYNPSLPSIYRDWQNNGPMNLAGAIQQSSDVYFYAVGGGYQDQPGMGINNINKYARLFGYGRPVGGSGIFGDKAGTVPSPAWKAATFDGAPWLLGNTYHSVIGQYGWQVTPAQVVRSIAAVANEGTLITPTIIKDQPLTPERTEIISLPNKTEYEVVHQGMRQSATIGTGVALNVNYTHFATKTGTAQTGVNNETYNSWIVGFWPYENPKYAFAILMERGPEGNLYGAPYVSRQFFDWMHENTPEYFNQ